MKPSKPAFSTGFMAGVLLALFFLGALFWAGEQDPFTRKWFALKTANGDPVKCVAVLPQLVQRRPVIIYAHGHEHRDAGESAA